MRESTARVRCLVCFGDGWIDLRDENALLAEHLDDEQLALVRLTPGWQHPIVRCAECLGEGEVPTERAAALDAQAREAVERLWERIGDA